MALLSRNEDPAAEREAIRARVHGVERTCAACGATAACEVESIHTTHDLNGNQLLYGVCRRCSPLERRGTLDRAAAAGLLDVDPDAVALDGIRLERFAARTSARPERPNPTPWAHVDVEALGRQVARHHSDLHRRTGGPCRYCGTTLTSPGTSWQVSNVNGRQQAECGSCHWWLASTPDRRDVAAAVLIGIATESCIPHVRNLGEQVGLVFFHETGRTTGAPSPWAHVDLRAVQAKADELIANRVINVPGPWPPRHTIAW